MLILDIIFKGLMKHFLKAKARKKAVAYDELVSNPYDHEKMKVTQQSLLDKEPTFE